MKQHSLENSKNNKRTNQSNHKFEEKNRIFTKIIFLLPFLLSIAAIVVGKLTAIDPILIVGSVMLGIQAFIAMAFIYHTKKTRFGSHNDDSEKLIRQNAMHYENYKDMTNLLTSTNEANPIQKTKEKTVLQKIEHAHELDTQKSNSLVNENMDAQKNSPPVNENKNGINLLNNSLSSPYDKKMDKFEEELRENRLKSLEYYIIWLTFFDGIAFFQKLDHLVKQNKRIDHITWQHFAPLMQKINNKTITIEDLAICTNAMLKATKRLIGNSKNPEKLDKSLQEFHELLTAKKEILDNIHTYENMDLEQLNNAYTQLNSKDDKRESRVKNNQKIRQAESDFSIDNTIPEDTKFTFSKHSL